MKCKFLTPVIAAVTFTAMISGTFSFAVIACPVVISKSGSSNISQIVELSSQDVTGNESTVEQG